jgi:hypothetical protein
MRRPSVAVRYTMPTGPTLACQTTLPGTGVGPVHAALLTGAEQLLRPAGDRVGGGGEQVWPGAEVEVRPERLGGLLESLPSLFDGTM